MISDASVLAEATRFMDRHGAAAAQRADENVRALLSIGDFPNLLKWKRLHAAILELEAGGCRAGAPR